jgi:hypothetical protein
MRQFRVDWERVHTVDDLKAILQAMDPHFSGSPAISHLLEVRPVEESPPFTVEEALESMRLPSDIPVAEQNRYAEQAAPPVAKECACSGEPCWHYQTQWLPLSPLQPADIYMCCNCGRNKMVWPSEPTGSGRTAHGLFAPQLTVRQET